MKLFFLVLNWIAGIFFALFGLSVTFSSFVSALFLFSISLVFLPPARKLIHSKTGRALKPVEKSVLVFMLFIGFGVFISAEIEKDEKEKLEQIAIEQAEEAARIKALNIKYFTNNKNEIIAKINKLVETEKYSSAVDLINKYVSTNDPDLNKLKTVPRTEQLIKELKGVKKANVNLNQALYEELVSLNPTNKTYKKKLAYYNKKIAAKAKATRLAAERKKKIDAQFSGWDGSHINLTKLIKESMNDPDSYDHVETVYWDQKNHLIVSTTFRGKNAFGAVVKDYIKAKVSLDGVILKTFE